MTTYAELKTKVARALQDPDNQTFNTDLISDMIEAAWQEVSLAAPWQFQEDITPTDNTLSYQVLSSYFTDPQPGVELRSVEHWDGSTTPISQLHQFQAASQHALGSTSSQVGWFVWNGTLYLPNNMAALIDSTTDLIRVWGYAPWPLPASDSDPLPFEPLLEKAVIMVCHIEALRLLKANRVLFKQWQTRSGNTDTTFPMLVNDLAIARQEWTSMERRIHIVREQPG